MDYRLVAGFDGVQRTADDAFIPNAAGNADWRAYQAWAAAGNTPAPVDLATLKAARTAAGVAQFEAKVAQGLSYGGKVLQIRDSDRSNIIGQALRAALALNPATGVAWDSGFAWRMADNSYLALPAPADMVALATAAGDRYAALRLRLGQLKDAIGQAADLAALEAIDISEGWDA